MSNRSEISKEELLKEIIQASRSRPVIPFIGSGVSISAGYPTIKLVIQYLAKVDFAIRFGVFQDRFPLVKGGIKAQDELVESYRQHPSSYLEAFGWPNMGQLDTDLWSWLSRSRKKKHFKIRGIESEGHHRIWCDSLKQYIKDQNLPEDEYNVKNSFIKIIERGDKVEKHSEIFGLIELLAEKQKIIFSMTELLNKEKRKHDIHTVINFFSKKQNEQKTKISEKISELKTIIINDGHFKKDHKIFKILKIFDEKEKSKELYSNEDFIIYVTEYLKDEERKSFINKIIQLISAKQKNNDFSGKKIENQNFLKDVNVVRTHLKSIRENPIISQEEKEVCTFLETLGEKQKLIEFIKELLKEQKSEEEISIIIDEIIKLILDKNNKKTSKKIIDYLSNDITSRLIFEKPKSPKKLETRDHLYAIVQWTLRQELASREYGAEQPILQKWLKWKTKYHGDKNKGTEDNIALLFGDWEGLLDKLCEGNFDLADTLFNELEKGLSPALSHRLLAFLQPKLGMPLIFTINFDSLLERAFKEERLKPKVFDIHRDMDLPTPELVRNQLSIIKLHGSSYGLRFGERLKQQLETDTRNDALQYLPENALILVIGFSGSERRMMQMLQAFIQKKDVTTYTPKLIWLQGPGDPGTLFNNLINGVEDHVKWCKIRHADTFLQELYFKIANSHQSTQKYYSSLPGQLRMADIEPELPVLEQSYEENILKRRPIQCFFANFKSKNPSGSWATLAGVAFTNSLDFSYRVIWIDLEYHQTIEGIIAEFFKKVRAIDPHAPSYNINKLRDNKNVKEIQKAVIRIQEVFQRGRYVLVLDSLESFGRPPLVHHGIPSIVSRDSTNLYNEFELQTNNFYIFLKELLLTNPKKEKKTPSDYYIVITVEKPHARHRNDGKSNFQNKAIKKIKRKTQKLLNRLISEDSKKKDSHVRLLKQKTNNTELQYTDFYNKNKHCPGRLSHPPTASLKSYWCSINTNEEKNKDRYIKRAKDILSLLKELRPEIAKDPNNKNSEKSIAAFICLSSFFRRPRTIPMLRSITTRWALRNIDSQKADEQTSDKSHEKVIEILEKITFNENKMNNMSIFLQRHEGGSIWLYREIHEGTYGALTEYLHKQKWDVKKYRTTTNIIAAILDGMVFISWHLAIARTYYVDVFMPTQDIKAFYEYLYHRVTAIRNIALLYEIITKYCTNDDWTSLIEKINQLEVDLDSFTLTNKESGNFVLYTCLIGIFSQIPNNGGTLKNSSKKTFTDTLKKLHKNSLETLLAALERNEHLFLAQSIPDEVLSWSEQFINHEIPCMRIPSTSDQDPAKDSIILLKELFLNMQFKAKMSKFYFNEIFCSEIASFQETDNSSFMANINDYIKKCRNSFIKNCSEKSPEELVREFKKLLRKVRCLIYLDFDKAYNLADIMVQQYQLISQKHPSKCSELDAIYREAVALKGKSLIARWPYWKPLLNRELKSLDKKSISLLKKIEQYSIDYEDTLRITVKTKQEDALHRSSSFALRARSLSLQGHFSEAHHFLDIGSTGLFLESIDHRTNASIIHLVRAELLAMSADRRYPEDKKNQIKNEDETVDKKLIRAVNTSLKKINRAEQELYQAEELLQNIAHEKIWLISVEFGWAQVQLERMLFEMELLFLQSRSLDKSEYLKKSGALEQLILSTMQRLRNVLDMIPYSSNLWSDEKPQMTEEAQKNDEYHPMLIKMERMSYSLWKQLFIAGAYYTGLLSEQYNNFTKWNDISKQDSLFVAIAHLNGTAITGTNSQAYQERWKLWCTAMRFKKLGENVELNLSLTPNVQSSLPDLEKLSLRATVIQAMKKECTNEKIDKIWDDRRL